MGSLLKKKRFTLLKSNHRCKGLLLQLVTIPVMASNWSESQFTTCVMNLNDRVWIATHSKTKLFKSTYLYKAQFEKLFTGHIHTGCKLQQVFN